MTDKELIKLFENKDKNSRNYWKYNKLSSEERNKIFELITKCH